MRSPKHQARGPEPRTRRPRQERLRAFSLCALWALGVLVAPLAHAEQHLREARALEQEEAALRALQQLPAAIEAVEASEPADALAWEELLLGQADPVPADIEAEYSPLTVYEVRRQADGALHDDGAGHLHAHGPAGHSHSHGAHGHSHGPGDSSRNPFEHGQGSLSHSAAALHVAAPPPPALLPPAREALVSHDLAPRTALPSWQRPACAQSPPR